MKKEIISEKLDSENRAKEKVLENMDQLLSVPQVAVILGCNQSKVNSILDAELIQPMKFGVKRKVRKSAVEEFLRQYEGFDISDPHNVVPITQSAKERYNAMTKGA
nr:helix-turn-helix domain-containing protein [uncultured Anaerosporobacter sp.]